MVQGILETVGVTLAETKDDTNYTTKDYGNFSSDLEEAQTKLEEKTSIANNASTEKKEKCGDDLIKEFQSACLGISICNKCAAIYRGASVSMCVKCGNDMKKDETDSESKKSVEKSADSGTLKATIQSGVKV